MTGTPCQTENDQIVYIERLLVYCSKKSWKIADIAGDDVNKCQFALVTEMPITLVDKVFKGILTEADTTSMSTGANLITSEKMMKGIATEEDTTVLAIEEQLITRDKAFKEIVTEGETTELTTGGLVHVETRLFKDIASETFITTGSTAMFEDTQDVTITVSTKQFETTKLTTGVLELTKEVEPMRTLKRFETTTEIAPHTPCARKIAETYLKVDGGYEYDAFGFKQFEKQFQKLCKTNYDKIQVYLKSAPSKRCNGTTVALASTTPSSVAAKKDTTVGEFGFNEPAVETESEFNQVTGKSCETIEEQIVYIERLLMMCVKRIEASGAAGAGAKLSAAQLAMLEALGNDVNRCHFLLTTLRPTIIDDKIFKEIQTEAESTVLSTGDLIVSTEKVIKALETGIETTTMTTEQQIIPKDKVFKDILTEAYSTEMSTGGHVITDHKIFKQADTETFWTTLQTTVVEHTQEMTMTELTKHFETTVLTTSVIEQTKEIEVLQTRRRIETTTEPFEKTPCSRKLAKTFLRLDDIQESDSYGFKQFEKTLQKQCKNQFVTISKYLKTVNDTKCSGSTGANVAPSSTTTTEKARSGKI